MDKIVNVGMSSHTLTHTTSTSCGYAKAALPSLDQGGH